MLEGVLNQHVQDSIIKLQMWDDKFLQLTHSVVKPEHFTSPETQTIVRVIYTYYDTYKVSPKDHFRNLLQDELEKRKVSDAEFDIYKFYLEKLDEITANKDYILNLISDFVRRATLRDAAIKFAGLLKKDKFQEAEQLMSAALKSANRVNQFEPISSEASYSVLSEYLSRNTRGLQTGYPHLDKLTGGLEGIVVLAGQPASGKSTFALNMAMHAAGHGIPVLYFDYENEKCKTMAKLLCITEEQDYKSLLDEFPLKYLKTQPKQYLSIGQLIYILDDKHIHLDAAESMVETVKEKHGSDQVLIVMDSLQKAPIIGGNDLRRDAIDNLLRQMEALKKSQGVTILAISEYKRVNGDYPAIPSITLLKESGDIEYTADLCLGLTPPTLFDDGDKKGKESRVHVLKNRYGDFTGEITDVSYRLIYPYWKVEEAKADLRANY